MKMKLPDFIKLPELSKKQIVIFTILCVLLLIDLVMLIHKWSTKTSPIVLQFQEEGLIPEKMKALNSAAGRGKIEKSGYAYFEFTENQKNNLRLFYKENTNASVVLQISVKHSGKEKNTDEQQFMYGYLYSSDFTEKGKLKSEIDKRALVSADLRTFSNLAAGFALKKDENGRSENIPSGFFIYSAVPVKLEAASVQSACVGWDFSTDVPFFGFASVGGRAVADAVSADFTGCTELFPVSNTADTVMPKIVAGFGPVQKNNSSENQKIVELNIGGETIHVYRAKDSDSVVMYTAGLIRPFSRVQTGGLDAGVTSLLMSASSKNLCTKEAGRTLEPYKTDPGFIPSWKKETWRTSDYELFEWNRFPGVLYFDTRNYDIQNDFFRRLAYYAEKTGYKGTLVSDEVLKDKHGYNAHDYSAETLAAFYTKADSERFRLNGKENLLRDILLKNGVIKHDGSGYKAGVGAVISISQDSTMWLRERFIAHEGWHGIFFCDEPFRNAVAAVYYTMDQTALSFLTGYWQTQDDLNYDQSDAYLMHNEFMAYLMQQPLSGTADYFNHLANRGSVMRGEPELAAYVRKTKGIAFEDAARILDDYALTNWGLACGRVSLVRR